MAPHVAAGGGRERGGGAARGFGFALRAASKFGYTHFGNSDATYTVGAFAANQPAGFSAKLLGNDGEARGAVLAAGSAGNAPPGAGAEAGAAADDAGLVRCCLYFCLLDLFFLYSKDAKYNHAAA